MIVQLPWYIYIDLYTSISVWFVVVEINSIISKILLNNYSSSPNGLWVIIIHQIFLLPRDWSKHVTWPNISQLKLGNTRISPIFKTARVAKKIWRIIKTIVTIWGKNVTIIPFPLVGYEIGPSWLFTISYPTCAHGIIVNYTCWGNF